MKTFAAGLIVALLPSVSFSQTTAPATTQAAPYHVEVPPGFELQKIEGFNVLLEKVNQPWIEVAIKSAPPATRPSTNASDLVEKLKELTPAMATQIAHDFALPDAKEPTDFITNRLLPAVQPLAAYNPPIYYLVTTEDRLKALLKNGWVDPQLHYNSTSDGIDVSPRLDISPDHPSEDLVLPAIYSPADPPELQHQKVGLMIRQSQVNLMRSIAQRTFSTIQSGILEFIVSRGAGPLHLKMDQDWLSVGLVGILSPRYLAPLVGASAQPLIEVTVADNPRNPMRPDMIDLLHPTNPSDLSPEGAPAYADAYRRKAARVVYALVTRGGEEAIPKTIASLRANPPEDGAAMLAQIQKVTGVDLSAEVKSK